MELTATLGDVQHNTLRYLLGTFCAGVCGFGIDGNANDVQTTAAVDYFIKGIGYTLAADAALDISADVDNIADIDALPTGYTCVYVFEADASGNYTVSAGEQVLTADITAGTKTADWPAPTSADVCPFAAVKVVNATGSNYVFGTTALDTAGITDTYYNLARVPARF